MEKAYKIKDSTTGLYSTGGGCPNWTSHGKTYSTVAHAKAAITAWLKAERWRVYYGEPKKEVLIPRSWQIVEFVITETNVWNAEELYLEKA